jgi:uncharacterized membrane protein YoaK (UPF0700 family)
MQPQDTSAQPAALSDAMLLAATGGLLDAVVYLNHGHVFANSMSGNVIFLGIAVLGRDWGDIVPYLLPLAGFLAASSPPNTCAPAWASVPSSSASHWRS